MKSIYDFIGRPCHANGDYGHITGISPDGGVIVSLYNGPPPDPWHKSRDIPTTTRTETVSLDDVRPLDDWGLFCAASLEAREIKPVVNQARSNAARHISEANLVRERSWSGPRYDPNIWDARVILPLVRSDLRESVLRGDIPDLGYTLSSRFGELRINTAEYRRSLREPHAADLDPALCFIPASDQEVRRAVLMIAYAYGCGRQGGCTYFVRTDGWKSTGDEVYGETDETRARREAECATACREIEERHPYPTLAELIGGAANVA